PAVRVPAGSADARGNFQSFVVDVGTRERRDGAMRALASAGIQSTIGTYAVTAQPLFRDRGYDPERTPHAARAMDRTLTLPLHPAMADGDIDRVVDTLAAAL